MIMKHLLIIAFIMASGACAAQVYRPICDCKITKTYGMMSRTWRLSGNVRIVTDPNEIADIRIKIVERGGSISVKSVDYTPSECGEWRWVDGKGKLKPKFTVRIVTDGTHDFTVKFVGKNEMSGSN
jgi:hypothetical protein